MSDDCNENQFPTQNVSYVLSQSGLQILNGLQGIFVKQKFEALEVLLGCDFPNVYKVFAIDSNGVKIGQFPLFKCKEISNCCVRNFLPGDCRPFQMQVSNNLGQVGQVGFEKSMFMILERPFKCTCCCLNRPILDVNIVENGSSQNGVIGRIFSPCLVCSLGVDIQDAQGNLKYQIEGNICQAGICCKALPCDSCQTVNLELKGPDGNIISQITKTTADCLISYISDTSNFQVQFPTDASAEDKALILSATLFLDFMYFEENNQNRNRVDD
ncbi:scramblase family protein, putative [Ichthyophthirius multifiliis]|uniref:Phospholipid scramblase n=1 Tax=Ichthyophthirius multifiliis TaxID=5932 RepID=G0R2L4_ICHMU|nr:scramblase family protein, putative [Ichthyophthirius multifiliis]EGR28278.1 scramblase family protein, putative [Ichthyophthirius multifiliis]|eukprot:XP_004027623.1 scramblase family protein, putative [Ichthyophthirius multifiliis]